VHDNNTNKLLAILISLSPSLFLEEVWVCDLSKKILQIVNPPHHHQPALHTKPYLSNATKEEII
jgi:hypothetical protein